MELPCPFRHIDCSPWLKEIRMKTTRWNWLAASVTLVLVMGCDKQREPEIVPATVVMWGSQAPGGTGAATSSADAASDVGASSTSTTADDSQPPSVSPGTTR